MGDFDLALFRELCPNDGDGDLALSSKPLEKFLDLFLGERKSSIA